MHCVFVFFAAFFVVYILGKMARGMVSRPGLRPRLHQEETVGCCLWCLLRCSFLWCFLAIFVVPVFVVRAAKVLHFITDLVVSYVGVVVVFSNVLCLQCFFFWGGRKTRRGTVHA